MWMLTTLEVVTRLISLSPPRSLTSALLPSLCPAESHNSSVRGLITPASPMFLFVTLLTLTGVYLRRACFSTLGKNFTFAHTTLQKHTLVTWGPYAYARHASYTAVAMFNVGIIAMFCADGGWISDCGRIKDVEGTGVIGEALVWTTWLLITGISAWSIVVTYALATRASREDSTLRAKFGKEWEDYRDRVPWKFIPFLL